MAGINLKQLQKQLQSAPVYTPMTDEQMQQQAQNKYASLYDQQRTAAQQAFDQTALALQQQRDQLAVNYGQQYSAAEKATRQSLSNADRYSVQRGMQRSSYNNANLANIGLEGNKTLNSILQGLTTAQGDVDERTSLLSQQLSQQLAGFSTQQQSDIQAYIDQLRQQEYERTTAAKQYADELQMRLYEYTQAAKKSGGGGGGSSKSGSKAPAATTPPPSTVGALEKAYKDADAAIKASYTAKNASKAKKSSEKNSKIAKTVPKYSSAKEQEYKNRRGF
jgi:hypothetical protein